VLGTAAVRDEGFLAAALERWGPEVVIGALDAKAGRVALSGWVEEGEPVEAVGRRFREAGLRTALHTDVARDGVGTGPNLDASVALARATGLGITVSGGVSGIEDVRAVARCGEPGIVGVIVGRALYDGSLDLAEALAVMRETPASCWKGSL
jgi:phosphoribosylformimino-5-aminoimidazole carboxamide ribotide isomerase